MIMLISDLMKKNIREQYLQYYPRNSVNTQHVVFINKIVDCSTIKFQNSKYLLSTISLP